MKTNAKFITFEGVDGSGKTTHVKLLQDTLKSKNIAAYITKEPGGTPLANDIRNLLLSNEIQDPVTEMLLISAARREHLKVIQQKLADGIWVISDRYIDSSLAYQGYAKGMSIDSIQNIASIAHEILIPDITFLLDIDPHEAQNRLSKSDNHNTFYDHKSIDFHIKIRNAFLDIYSKNQERIIKIDSAGKQNNIQTKINEIVDSLLI